MSSKKNSKKVLLLSFSLVLMSVLGGVVIYNDFYQPASNSNNTKQVPFPYSSNYTSNNTWRQFPLRTHAQESLGLFGGEGMQIIWSIKYAPSNDSVLYLVTDTSRVWKSTDGGNMWVMKHAGFLTNGGVTLTVDPINENRVLVAGSLHLDGGITSPYVDGIYLTLDGGESWTLVKRTAFYRPTDDFGGSNNFAFTKYGIFAGTHKDGLLKSIDGGLNWTSLDLLTGIKITDIIPVDYNKNILFIATRDGLYKLMDIDTSAPVLEKFGNNLPGFPKTVIVDPQDPSNVYVTVKANQISDSTVFKSTNAGVTFNKINNGLRSDVEYTYLAISPVDSNYLYISALFDEGNHPYFSHDAGVTWQQPTIMDKNGLLIDISLTSGGEWWSSPISMSPKDKNIAIASGNGNNIQKTIDAGITWEFSGNGFTGGRLGSPSHAIDWDINDANKFTFFLTDYGPMTTIDGGLSFKGYGNLPRHNFQRTTPTGDIHQNIIITAVGSWNKQVITVSQDSGVSWTVFDGIDQPLNTEDNYFFISFHEQNPKIVYAGKYKSVDGGLTWKELPRKIDAMYDQNSDIVYSVEQRSETTVILKSIDGGQTWTEPYPSLMTQISGGADLTIDSANEDKLFLAMIPQGLFILDQQGWHQINKDQGYFQDNFGEYSTISVVIDPNNSSIMYTGRWIDYLGVSNGIFRSIDGGVTWEYITGNLGPNFSVFSLSINPITSYIYLGSSYGTFMLPPP